MTRVPSERLRPIPIPGPGNARNGPVRAIVLYAYVAHSVRMQVCLDSTVIVAARRIGGERDVHGTGVARAMTSSRPARAEARPGPFVRTELPAPVCRSQSAPMQ